VNSNKLISLNPSTGEEVGKVEITPPQQVPDLVRQAQAAYPYWKKRGLTERTEIIRKVQQELLRRKEEFARLMSKEMGKPLTESLGLEVHACIDIMRYYVKQAHNFLGNRRVPLHHLLFMWRGSWLHFEPLGVLGVISPWNWPMLIPLGSIIPALLSGNAVIFKPSELTPILAEKMRKLFIDKGVPADIFQIIQGGADQGKALIESPVEKIFFTGSTRVGRIIYSLAAQHLKKCVLEMGGSDPAIVCSDADIDYATSGILWGSFSNCGQNCNAIERVFVHHDVLDSFLEKLVEKIEKLHLGNSEADDTDMGPLASPEQLDKMISIVKQSQKSGDRILCGGQPLNQQEGYFFQPTVILRTASDYQEDTEELFGPLVYVTPVSSEQEAVELANRTKYGLASSVWTQNKRKGMRLASALQAGTVMINDVIVSFGMAEAGWTGIKQSAIGWVHGEKGLDEMVNIKYINYDPQNHMQKFWWFPYNQMIVRTFMAALEFLFAGSWFRKVISFLPVLRRMGAYMLFNRHRKDKL